IGQHQLFSQLDARLAELIADHAALQVHTRGDEIFREGERAESVLVVKSGVAKLQRRTPDGVSVLAYFNAGDVVRLSEGHTCAGTLVSTGFVEVIRAARRRFAEIERTQPGFLQHFRKSELSGNSRIRSIEVGERGERQPGPILAFVDELVKEGAQEAQSLLTI